MVCFWQFKYPGAVSNITTSKILVNKHDTAVYYVAGQKEGLFNAKLVLYINTKFSLGLVIESHFQKKTAESKQE